MKRFLLVSFVLSLGLCGHAQEVPQITLTAEVDGQSRTFELGNASRELNEVTIDWGDGNVVEGVTLTAIYDGYNATQLTGTPVGEGHIRIFATGGLSYFDCVSKVSGSGITALDVTHATELTELAANGNKLTTIDLSKNEKLAKALLNNNALESIVLQPALVTLNLQNNQLTSFDAAQLPLLKTLYLSDNQMEELDLSANANLTSAYLLNMGLKHFNLGANTNSKLYVSVNNNLLTTLDVTEATGLSNGRLFAMNNNLKELKYTAIGTANLSGNQFTLATLPVAGITTLTYAPQQAMDIEDIAERIDLSAQNNIQGLAAEPQPTTYTWMTTSGAMLEAGVDYTEADGTFTFIQAQADSVYCVMTTAAFPKFTGANVFRTKAVPVQVATGIDSVQGAPRAEAVEVYGLDGVKIETLTAGYPKVKGVYVMRRNGKASKILVK